MAASPPTRRIVYIADTKHASIWHDSKETEQHKKSKYVGERRVTEDITSDNRIRITNSTPPPPKNPSGHTAQKLATPRIVSFSAVCFPPATYYSASTNQHFQIVNRTYSQSQSGDAPALLNGVLDGNLIMAAVDQRGTVYLFHYGVNKYWLVTRTGVAGTSLAFGFAARTELVVAFADRTVRSFNVGMH
ncbi:hypothetical protein BC937DRAFT_87025 [Endogone sp. FLAS-F59071]|nr:hypothetical protein BC937DRAFT_87025 [Endogone sp. FLAS-F59071]|eukprot:RUS19735.1 hypothetical protein BC937DRAFT_87025 [Endogone sp. FLAS-F59071]